jgi:hypothetical protein
MSTPTLDEAGITQLAVLIWRRFGGQYEVAADYFRKVMGECSTDHFVELVQRGNETLTAIRELLISLGDYTGNVDKRTGIDRCAIVGKLAGVPTTDNAKRTTWKAKLTREIDALTDEMVTKLDAHGYVPETYWKGRVIANTSETLYNVDPRRRLDQEYKP